MKYLYLALFSIATALALFLTPYRKSFVWFGYSLVILLLPEYYSIYTTLTNSSLHSYVVYHINIPLFLILMFNFFKDFIVDEIVRKILFATIVVNVIVSIGLTVYFYELRDFPGIQLNTMGIIMISICLYIILTLEPIQGVPIYKHPMAWICLGYIVFFSATFFLNGIFNKLVEISSPYLAKIHRIINLSSNYFLYASIIIGLIFSNRIAHSEIKK